jgi:hypothetical protein
MFENEITIKIAQLSLEWNNINKHVLWLDIIILLDFVMNIWNVENENEKHHLRVILRFLELPQKFLIQLNANSVAISFNMSDLILLSI